MDCETSSSFEGESSDHQIIKRQILRKNAARKTTTVHYVWFLLNNWNVRDKYTLTLRKNFDRLQEKSETNTPNDKHENFVNVH